MTDKTITKEGIQVRVGQVWRDLDVRMGDRQLPVVIVDEVSGKACMRRKNGSLTCIAIRRMHKSATGWALVRDVDP